MTEVTLSALARARLRLARDDNGSITLFVVVIALGLLVAVGLVVDGGGKVRALQRADDVAAEAARAGGQAISSAAVLGQTPEAAAGDAQAAARAYLTSAGVAGTVTLIGGTRLSIDTTTSYTPVFLDIIGIGTQTTTGHADVRLVRALDGEQ